LQDADAEDVTQIVLLKLANRMKEFRYDPSRSFRAWLKTVAHHAWKDFVESKQRAVPGIGQAGEEWTLLSNIEARDDLVKGLEEQFDLELLEKALEAVRPRVAPNNWQAFCLTALEGMSANETAERLGMKIARVYAARSTIQQLLQQECRRLEGEQEPGG
jgi:RNA polymerase sigma-70 factor (ECF subfamily)